MKKIKRKMLAAYMASGLTPLECQELAEAKRAGRLCILPDFREFSERLAEAIKNNTYGPHTHEVKVEELRHD